MPFLNEHKLTKATHVRNNHFIPIWKPHPAPGRTFRLWPTIYIVQFGKVKGGLSDLAPDITTLEGIGNSEKGII